LKPDSRKPEILFTGNWHIGLFMQLINLGSVNSKVRQLAYINVLGFLKMDKVEEGDLVGDVRQMAAVRVPQ